MVEDFSNLLYIPFYDLLKENRWNAAQFDISNHGWFGLCSSLRYWVQRGCRETKAIGWSEEFGEGVPWLWTFWWHCHAPTCRELCQQADKLSTFWILMVATSNKRQSRAVQLKLFAWPKCLSSLNKTQLPKTVLENLAMNLFHQYIVIQKISFELFWSAFAHQICARFLKISQNTDNTQLIKKMFR